MKKFSVLKAGDFILDLTQLMPPIKQSLLSL